MVDSDAELDALLDAGLNEEIERDNLLTCSTDDKNIQVGCKRRIENTTTEQEKEVEFEDNKKQKLGSDKDGGEVMMGPFTPLSAEIMYGIFIRLSAVDLSNCCQVCKGFRNYGTKDQLWTRLFEQRWGTKIENLQTQTSKSCKKRYFEKDQMELNGTLSNVASDMLGFYLQMHVAKRQQSPNKDKVSMVNFFVDGEMGKKVRDWRTEQGFQAGCEARPDMNKKHRWKNIGKDVYLCETNGWMHVCGEQQCTEKIEHRLQGNWVCPISGQTFGSVLIDEGEEFEQEEEADQEFNLAGFLGRAFVDGYNASSEAEVRNMFSWRYG